eukprot:scaffold1900_cov123-Cylindrotheca_fusiformis.AAC.43
MPASPARAIGIFSSSDILSVFLFEDGCDVKENTRARRPDTSLGENAYTVHIRKSANCVRELYGQLKGSRVGSKIPVDNHV